MPVILKNIWIFRHLIAENAPFDTPPAAQGASR